MIKTKPHYYTLTTGPRFYRLEINLYFRWVCEASRVVVSITRGVYLQRAVSLFTNFTFCNSRSTFEMTAMAKKWKGRLVKKINSIKLHKMKSYKNQALLWPCLKWMFRSTMSDYVTVLSAHAYKNFIPFCWQRLHWPSWCLVLSSFCSCVLCVVS